MRFSRRHPLFVAVLLCASAVLVARPTAADSDGGEAPGQRIGQRGTIGISTGPHLHFEARVTPELGSGVVPVPWLKNHGVEL